MESVRIPKNRDGRQRTFGFITFKHDCSVPYCLALFEGTSLYNKVLHLESRGKTIDTPQVGIGLKGSQGNERQRTQSVPLNFGTSATASPAVPDYNLLLQLGQQMLIPASLGSMPGQFTPFDSFPRDGGPSLYASQMNSNYYLGGLTPNTNNENNKVNNRDSHGHNRNHPYSRGAGSRGYEHNHSNSSSYSPHRHHDRGHRGRRY